MNERHSDFYYRLRTRMRKWIASREGASHQWMEYLMCAPDLFHLLCKLSMDDQVPTREKAKLAAAIAYFIAPVDLFPEFMVGPAGYVDDVAVSAYVLNALLNRTNPEVLRKHWAGEKDVLLLIQAILGAADRMVGSGLWSKIRKRF